jgi:hypothetical protein
MHSSFSPPFQHTIFVYILFRRVYTCPRSINPIVGSYRIRRETDRNIMKSDQICPDSETRNHIGVHSVEFDRILSSNRQSDPTAETLGVSILCLILIKLKSEALGIWATDPSVIPTIGSDRIQHCRSQCDSESRKPIGIQSEPIEFCRMVGSYKIRSNPVSD